MNDDEILKYVIAFILGWIVCRMIGNGFSVGGGTVFSPAIKFFKHAEDEISHASGWNNAKKDVKRGHFGQLPGAGHDGQLKDTRPHIVKCPDRANITESCIDKENSIGQLSEHCEATSCENGTGLGEDCATRYSWVGRGASGNEGPIRCKDAGPLHTCRDGNRCSWDHSEYGDN